MSMHTPGPWNISGMSMNDGSISIGHAEYRIVIAYVTNAASLGDFVAAAMRGRRDFGAPDTAKAQWANARLIAAAPDLLAALIAVHQPYETLTQDALEAGILMEFGPPKPEKGAALLLARAAITKATTPAGAERDE